MGLAQRETGVTVLNGLFGEWGLRELRLPKFPEFFGGKISVGGEDRAEADGLDVMTDRDVVDKLRPAPGS